MFSKKTTTKAQKAHITGSRAYGVPKADSDIDLVVLVSDEDYNKLLDRADSIGSKTEHGLSIRFGCLNVIVTTDEKEYHQWANGTAFLKSIAPVSKDIAILMFERFFHATR